MRTSDNTLSFWLYDSDKNGSFEDVALALAATRDTVQRLDLVWVDEEQVKKMELSIRSAKGQTPAKHLQDSHRDVVGVDLTRLVRLARTVAKAVSNNQMKRFTEKQIGDFLAKAARDKLISTEDFKKSIAKKIEQNIG